MLPDRRFLKGSVPWKKEAGRERGVGRMVSALLLCRVATLTNLWGGKDQEEQEYPK